MKKLLVISSSLRNGSNSDYLARTFAKGAIKAGNEAEIVSLSEKKISFCIGCFTCQKTQKCILKDDAAEIAEKVKNADVLVFATPVYYYGMSGQLKTLLDRMNPLYTSDYSFREVYVIATAADSDPGAIDGTVTGIEGWVSCFEKCRIAGVIRGVGIEEVNEALKHEDILKQAYNAGRAI